MMQILFNQLQIFLKNPLIEYKSETSGYFSNIPPVNLLPLKKYEWHEIKILVRADDPRMYQSECDQ